MLKAATGLDPNRHSPDHMPHLSGRRHTPLASLNRLKSKDGTTFFSKGQMAAITQLNHDFEAGYCTGHMSTNWQAFGAGGGLGYRDIDMPLYRMKARAAYEGAMGHLGHPVSDMIRRMMQEDLTLTLIERNYALARGHAKLAVREALERLAVYYGY